MFVNSNIAMYCKQILNQNSIGVYKISIYVSNKVFVFLIMNYLTPFKF